ncbi:hypothetical protein BH10PSE6_BH10PSE6_05030 [soil metagenome]
MKPIVNGIHTREDVWKLPSWDPTLLWYARGVAHMQTLPLNNFRGWRYQGAIHEYVRAFDPLAVQGEALPSTADQKRFWTQCQHGTWYFLPWHRIYLAFFEQIVRQHIVALGGPVEWALPYWNYSDSSNLNFRNARPEFVQPTLPGGATNALAAAARRTQTGNYGISANHVDLTCLKTVPFMTGSNGAPSGFGGPKTGFEHAGGTIGDLEGVPHGTIHTRVGGPGGWMSSFATAALDPLFWLHHANIDRLWEVWRSRGPQFQDPSHPPSNPAWGAPSGTVFRLQDATGTVVPLTVDQVVDTKATVLSYQYEDIFDPFPGAALGEEDMPTGPAALVGASEQPIRLTSEPTTAVVRLDAAAIGEQGAALAEGEEPNAYLNIENIVGNQLAPSYEVYVNADGDGPGTRYAGILSMFGLVERSSQEDPHGGGGLSYVLDITDLVRRLRAANAWDDEKLRVTFVPTDEDMPASTLKIGRISLYYR